MESKSDRSTFDDVPVIAFSGRDDASGGVMEALSINQSIEISLELEI